MISFAKYHGAGNDFILIEDPTCSFVTSHHTLIPSLCNRHTGIGADGLILLQPSHTCAIKMQIFNSDASEPGMCGNGIRCLAHFAFEKGWVLRPEFTIETKAGPFSAHVINAAVAITFPQPQLLHEKILIDTMEMIVVDTGVPHGVIFTPDLKTLDVPTLGKKIRNDPRFSPWGINVNFASRDPIIAFRTYERGVEGETQACGTGAVAVAYAAHGKNQKEPLNLLTRGGHILKVCFAEKIPSLIGPAEKVFEGSIPVLVQSSN